MNISDIKIPDQLVAQYPNPERESCKLLCLEKKTGDISHRVFSELPLLVKEGDLMVFNNSKVVKARFDGAKSTGGKVELFLIRSTTEDRNSWHCLIKGKNIQAGAAIYVGGSSVKVSVISHNEDGTFLVKFANNVDISKIMEDFGRLPLPPYIKRMPNPEDNKYYQTVFANIDGSVAAPTAALHFTDELIERIKAKGVKTTFVTLHIGYGTFSMIRDLDKHIIHDEFYSVPQDLEVNIRECKAKGGRVWAVGTTVVRTLESSFNEEFSLINSAGFTKLFIKPGYKFKVVDCVVTNFHHPETTLIYLVAAAAGVDNIVSAYKEAVSKEYRLLSYGDAMAII